MGVKFTGPTSRVALDTTTVSAVAANRGRIFYTKGGAGVADKIYCVMKDAAGDYSAVQVAVG